MIPQRIQILVMQSILQIIVVAFCWQNAEWLRAATTNIFASTEKMYFVCRCSLAPHCSSDKQFKIRPPRRQIHT